MSLHLSPSSAIQLCSDGTCLFKDRQYHLCLPSHQKLNAEQCQKIVPYVEQFLKPQLATLERLDSVKFEGMKIPDDIQLSESEQLLFKRIQEIAFEVISPSLASLKTQEQDLVQLPPLPALNQKKEKKVQFPWPPRRLNEHIAQSVQQLQKCVQNFSLDANDQSFFDGFEDELKAMKSFKKAELEKFVRWGTTFYQKELKDRPDVPLFFKDDFNQLLQRMRQAISWKGVQKSLEGSIKKGYRTHVLDVLFHEDASNSARHLGQILLHIYQADRPHFLQLRLQSADKLFANLIKHELLEKEDQHLIHALLQELHQIANPFFSPSLEGRVKAPTIPSYSKLDKLKKALRLIFTAIAQLFQRRSSDKDAQKSPDYLLVEHEDFDGNLFAREEVFRHDAVLDLVASKQEYLDELMNQDHRPKYTMSRIEKDLASYKKFHANHAWLPAYQVQEDFVHYQQEQTDKKEISYIPALINSRTHQITTENDTLIIHRSGSISDRFHASTHLDELKMKAMDQWQHLIQADSFEEFHSLAINQLKKGWNGQLYHTLQTIEKRQCLLEDQMVQLIANQVKAHIADIADPSYLTLTRLMRIIQITQIGLLNPLKEQTEESGLFISERNQMLDMAAIFQHFDGKCIQFKDIDAPFMKDDTIYLPLSFLEDPKTGKSIDNPDIEEPFILSCTFFNTSVQGLTINKGEQRIVNEEALAQMEYNLENIQAFLEDYPEYKSVLKTSLSDLYQRFKDLDAKLERGDTSYAVAQEIAKLQHDMQGMVGVNCSNGQDRTSYLVANLVAQHMDSAIDPREDWPQAEKKALKRKLRRDLMDMDKGLASQVVQENTGRKALQLYEKDIMGINTGEGYSGDFVRFGYSLFAFTQS